MRNPELGALRRDFTALRREVGDLREAVRRLQAELARVESPTHYSSSRKHGSPPPSKSHRWFREHAPEMPGAYRLGNSWAISVDNFDAWVAKNRPRRTPSPLPDEPWSPAMALASAGVRDRK